MGPLEGTRPSLSLADLSLLASQTHAALVLHELAQVGRAQLLLV